MKLRIALVATVLSLCGLGIALVLYERDPNETGPAGAPAQVVERRDSRPSGDATSRPAATPERIASDAASAAGGLPGDALTTARLLYPQAEAGNPDAQFALYRTLDYCDREYHFFFLRGKTLDEVLAWESGKYGSDTEEIRRTYEHCRALKEAGEQFGSAATWLQRATEAGHALAEAASATKMLLAATHHDPGQGASEPHRITTQEQRKRAEALLKKALGSKQPGVLWTIGDMQLLLSGSETHAQTQQWAWRLAACHSGYDCSESADWVRFMCRYEPNCQPYETGEGFIRQMTGNDYPEVVSLAREIATKFKNGTLDYLYLSADQG